ncbi:MAG: mechanosensitive ion channel [Candidatus Promineifilaceae bacterium]|nr:mechanosensitive ion channel [Candidatus Promineifilaceae bacterium]
MNEQSAVELLVDQFWTLLVFLQRPTVQRQLLLVGLLLAAGILLGRWLARRLSRRARRPAAQRLVQGLALPVVLLLLGYGSVLVLRAVDHPDTLVLEFLTLLWIWVAYRVLLALLSLRLEEAVIRQLRWRVLLPLVAWFIFARLAGRAINLSVLASIDLFSAFGAGVTLGGLFLALVVLYIFLALSWALRVGIRRTFSDRTRADPGVINSVTTIVGYAAVASGLLAAVSALGLSLSSLAIIGGGLSVGIGIGLQQIVANFISGIVLLFEQSLRPGDVIEMEGEVGIVEEVNIRSTVVRTNDHVELIVPNEAFVISQVRTFTKSSPETRIRLPVPVSYRSDPHQVRQVLVEAVVDHPSVLASPPPHVFFRAFGDYSLDFEVAVWIDQPLRRPWIRGDLYFRIWDALKEAGIEVPYPQRDLHLRSGWAALRADEDDAG